MTSEWFSREEGVATPQRVLPTHGEVDGTEERPTALDDPVESGAERARLNGAEDKEVSLAALPPLPPTAPACRSPRRRAVPQLRVVEGLDSIDNTHVYRCLSIESVVF